MLNDKESILMLENRLNMHKSNIIQDLKILEGPAIAKAEWKLITRTLKLLPSSMSFISSADNKYCQLAVYLPSNLPIYSMLIYGIIPGLYAKEVHIKITPELKQICEYIVSIIKDQIAAHFFLHTITGRDFADKLCDAHCVIFCGRYDTSRRAVKRHYRSMLFMYIGSGVNPFIVFPDANVEHSALEAFRDRSFNFGQDCLCSDVFFIHKTILRAWIEDISKLIKEHLKYFALNTPISSLVHKQNHRRRRFIREGLNSSVFLS